MHSCERRTGLWCCGRTLSRCGEFCTTGSWSTAERPSLSHIVVPLQIHLLLPIVPGVQGGGHNNGLEGINKSSNENSSCWGSDPGYESMGGDEGLPSGATALGSRASSEEKGIVLSGVGSVAGGGNSRNRSTSTFLANPSRY